MKVCSTVDELRARLRPARPAAASIGFVPTMGFLHEGHLALIRRAREQCGVVVVSIFVNPTQFGPNEDLAQYPRDLGRDLKLCEAAGVDLVFAPPAAEMYPEGYQTHVEVEILPRGLCGARRPGHFRGVATVVAKLLNITQPDRAYFGEKDAQQLRVVRRMVRDLDLPVEIVGVPTVREEDGLAASSRNARLSAEERRAAPVLYRALLAARDLLEGGERRTGVLTAAMQELIVSEPMARPDYVEIVDDETLEPVDTIDRPALAALAVFLGDVRLIDNMTLAPHANNPRSLSE